MNKKWKQTGVALVAALGLFASACVTSGAVESKDPLVVYYAALADYNGAKLIAARYVELPSTTKEEATRVLQAVVEGDEAVDEFERLRAQCAAAAAPPAPEAVASCLPADRLAALGRVLQIVAAELRARAVEVK